MPGSYRIRSCFRFKGDASSRIRKDVTVATLPFTDLLLLDLTQHPDVKFARVKWDAQRWGKGDSKPLFGFYVFAQEMRQQILAASA